MSAPAVAALAASASTIVASAAAAASFIQSATSSPVVVQAVQPVGVSTPPEPEPEQEQARHVASRRSSPRLPLLAFSARLVRSVPLLTMAHFSQEPEGEGEPLDPTVACALLTVDASLELLACLVAILVFLEPAMNKGRSAGTSTPAAISRTSCTGASS